MKNSDRISFDPFFFRLTLGVFIIIGFLQAAADVFDWYYIFPKLDTPMHVLGGMLVGFAALAFSVRGMNVLQKLLWVTGWTLVVGIGVECFEWVLSNVFHIEIGMLLQPGVMDTYGDLLHDMIGGTLAFCAAYFMRKI